MKSKQNRIIYKGKVVVKKWGNSQGVRIPKEVLDSIAVSEGDTMQLCIDNDTHSIILRRESKRLKLKERLELFYGKPIDEIPPMETQEVEWGAPQGEEIC